MLEFFITLIACIAAVWIKRDSLTAILVGAWTFSLVAAIYAYASFLPGIAALIDMSIAICALMLWTEHGSQRARIVGALSLIKLFIHFGVSANFGAANWGVYALLINSLFVCQCLIAGGAFRGLGNFIDSFSPRHPVRNASVHEKER